MVLTGDLVRAVSMERWEQKSEPGLEQMRGGEMERGVCRSCSGCLWRKHAKDNSWEDVESRVCFCFVLN